MDDDYMDIDLVEPKNKEISYISKNRNFSNKQKYCDICKSNKHNTDCKYNGLKRRNRNNNNKNTSNNKNNNSNNKYTKS